MFRKFGTGEVLGEDKVDKLGRAIPEDGMVSPDGDDAEAHNRMVKSWEDEDGNYREPQSNQ